MHRRTLLNPMDAMDYELLMKLATILYFSIEALFSASLKLKDSLIPASFCDPNCVISFEQVWTTIYLPSNIEKQYMKCILTYYTVHIFTTQVV